MKRKDLLEIGVPEDTINDVMKLYGKSVSDLEDKLSALEQSKTDLEKKITERDADLKSLKEESSNNEDLQNKISDWERKYVDLETNSKKELDKLKIANVIEVLGRENHIRNPEDLKSFVNLDDVEIQEDGTATGLKEQIDNLKEQKPYLFNLGEKTGGYTPGKGQDPQSWTKDKIMSIKDTAERQKLISENLDLFN